MSDDTALPADETLAACPCGASMKYFDRSDEFEGAVSLRCTRCWLVFDCCENSKASARELWRNTVARPSPARDKVLEEEVAQFLHDEGGFGDAWSHATWPEHSDDTGQRDCGFVKIVPCDVQAKFREVAARLVRGFPALKAQPPSTVGEDATAGEFVMVPREPTEGMLAAVETVAFDNEDEHAMGCNVWNAMIAAAPKPTQPSIGMDEREKIAREVLAAEVASGTNETAKRWLAPGGGYGGATVSVRQALRAMHTFAHRLALSATPVDVGEGAPLAAGLPCDL
jgi:hypothetical protein